MEGRNFIFQTYVVMNNVNIFDFRKAMCREFGLKVAQTSFSSDFSNANADKVGFKTDIALRYQL